MWLICGIQIKYGLPYCVTCPSTNLDSGSLNSVRGEAEYPGGGSRDPYECWAGGSFGNTFLICIIGPPPVYSVWHSVSEGGHE